ncbi:MAG: DUF92 domain-containing protein [Sphingobacteriales bacterium]
MAILHYLPIVLIIAVGSILSVMTQKLSFWAAITAAAVGLLVFAGEGYTGFIMLSAFFLFGILATSWKKAEKHRFKAKSDRSVKRTAGQVFANGGVAAILGLFVLWMPHHAGLFRLMMAAALSSATADTLSSELGMIYGYFFFNITTLRRESKGLDGVISLTGTLIGIAGSAVIAFIYCLNIGKRFWLIVFAGTIGNLADSLFGATYERKGMMGNNTVNFLNTLAAALTAWLLHVLFKW